MRLGHAHDCSGWASFWTTQVSAHCNVCIAASQCSRRMDRQNARRQKSTGTENACAIEKCRSRGHNRRVQPPDLVEQMQFLPWLEADGASRRDWNFGARSRVASNAGFPGLDAEHAKAAQFDAISGSERIFHTCEDGIYRRLCFHARQPCPLRDFMHHILFDQMSFSFGCWMHAPSRIPMLGSSFRDCQWSATLVHSA